ncbi:MAG: DUF2306 domain-containing protein [Pyrinomonadaceae bacterium]
MDSTISIASQQSLGLRRFATKALRAAAGTWFVTAVIGQLIFVYYLLGLYGRGALRGDFEVLSKVMPHGYVPGDTFGNLAVFAHVLLAVVVTLGGALQLTPQVRNRFPAFHRWNGRVYLTVVVATSLIGLYMVWFRGSVGDLSQHLGISLDAVLILAFSALALRTAMNRKLADHRRWALRLFLVSSAVWFFRISLMFWLVINQGPAGFDPDTFTGPFLTFLSFADYLIPLAVLEIYFYARERGETPAKMAAAAALFVLTLAMSIGILAATMLMWLPRV